MSFPIKTCIICSEEFELRPDKPGFANRCPSCSEPEEAETVAKTTPTATAAVDRRSEAELNEARRRTIREMLYRGDS
jgi:hypothetical protein